ncbi:hydroxyacid dehydrogenase [Oleispirillum naphthae]|uniref:hydroxyacid dehydrogenase n=1 Tax=Oleispirillum naphthae TaxID=2838853 RepID=UPI0030823508
MSARIIVTGPSLADEAMALLRERGVEAAFVPPYTTPADLAAMVARERPEALLVRMGEIDDAVIGASDRLKAISKHGVGYNNIDVAAATRRGIPVMVAHAANARSVAEMAMAMIYVLVKRLFALDAGLRAGRWEKPGFNGMELTGKCLGIVGLGSIGRNLAALAAPLAMRILAFDPAVPEEAVPQGVRRVGSLAEMLGEADVLSLNCPLTETTRNIIGAAELAAMKPTAFLINTARGGLIDENALAAALRDGVIAGAGIDSFATEPAPAEHPLWGLPNVIVTPHVAGVTREASARVGLQAVRNILTVFDGKRPDPVCVVNPEALTTA